MPSPCPSATSVSCWDSKELARHFRPNQMISRRNTLNRIPHLVPNHRTPVFSVCVQGGPDRPGSAEPRLETFRGDWVCIAQQKLGAAPDLASTSCPHACRTSHGPSRTLLCRPVLHS